MSSRPGARLTHPDEEWRNLERIIKKLRRDWPENSVIIRHDSRLKWLGVEQIAV